MTVKPVDAHPEQTEPERNTTDTIRVGDILCWGGLLVKVNDMISVDGHVRVLLARFDRDNALPIPVSVNDLDGADVWCFAGTYKAVRSLHGEGVLAKQADESPL
jgi:hypothetical protein